MNAITEIKNYNTDVKNNTNISFLKEIGFTNANGSFFKKIEEDIIILKERFGISFIFKEHFKEIENKYNLKTDNPEYFIGSIPEKNIKEIEQKFQEYPDLQNRYIFDMYITAPSEMFGGYEVDDRKDPIVTVHSILDGSDISKKLNFKISNYIGIITMWGEEIDFLNSRIFKNQTN